MENLKRIENLPPSQRSSRVGQAGVFSDLKSLEQSDALNWLHTNVSSPVTRDWGRLLASLSVDWYSLKVWMSTDKEHAIAAVDAISQYVATKEELPPSTNNKELIAELERLLSLYPTPKFKEVYDELALFINPPPLTKNLATASKILLKGGEVALREKNTKAKWTSLLHKANGKYCLAILDWKATSEQVATELSTLPIVLESSHSSLCYESIDIGGDEIVIVALPLADLKSLKNVMPKSFNFDATEIRPSINFEVRQK